MLRLWPIRVHYMVQVVADKGPPSTTRVRLWPISQTTRAAADEKTLQDPLRPWMLSGDASPSQSTASCFAPMGEL